MASRPSPWRSLGLELYLEYNSENVEIYGGRIGSDPLLRGRVVGLKASATRSVLEIATWGFLQDSTVESQN